MVWDARPRKVLELDSRKDTVEPPEELMVGEADTVVLSPIIRNKWPSANKITPNHITLDKKQGMKAQEVETARVGPAYETLEAMAVE